MQRRRISTIKLSEVDPLYLYPVGNDVEIGQHIPQSTYPARMIVRTTWVSNGRQMDIWYLYVTQQSLVIEFCQPSS
jgi:hypothetical protein